MFFLPWWILLACLAGSAFATYLLLKRTQVGDSPWAIFPLTAALAPVVLAGAVVAAIVFSTLLSALLEDQPSVPSESTGAESTFESTFERTVPSTTTIRSTSPSASPSASPTGIPPLARTHSPYATLACSILSSSYSAGLL